MTAGAKPDRPDSPVEQLLDRLLILSPGNAREVRTALAEAEAHLAETVNHGMSRGLTRHEAEVDAVRRFGSAELVTAHERRWRRAPVARLVREGALTALFLGVLGGLAVGASGLLAGVMQWLGGSTFIVDISKATRLPATDCARWLTNDPHASSCYQAALSDWAAETVFYRLALGALGAFGLLALAFLRRRAGPGSFLLPSLVVNTIGTTVFGAAGVLLLGQSIAALATAAHGAGQWLSAAPIAIAIAIWFAYRLIGDLQAHPARDVHQPA